MTTCMYGIKNPEDPEKLLQCDGYCGGFIGEEKKQDKYLRGQGFICRRQIYSTDTTSLL